MSEQEFVEKPFAYIPFAERVRKRPPAGHDRFVADLRTGYLAGTIEVLTPLHIGAGTTELTKRVAPQYASHMPLVKAFVRSNGQRIIPGSTLKGAVRSIVEAITPSTVGKVGFRVRLPNRDLEEPRSLKRENRAARNLEPPAQNPLSPADRLFGVMDYLGPVQFSDAPQEGDAVEITPMPPLYSPQETQVKGRKFYKHGKPATGGTPVETIPVGTQLPLRCDFTNLTNAEVGLLLLALGQGAPPFHLKIGGNKPSCYGSIGITISGVHVHADVVAAYLHWETEEEQLDIQALVAAALAEEGLVLQPQLQRLAETLTYPNNRDCPEGNY